MPKSIALLPAYGGWDYGPSGNGLVGKAVVLAAGVALAQALSEAGVPVVLGRTLDEPIGGARNADQELAQEVAWTDNVRPELAVRLSLGQVGSVLARTSNTAIWPLANTLSSALQSYWWDAPSGAVAYNAGWVGAVKAPAIDLCLGNPSFEFDASHLHTPTAMIDAIAGALIDWAGGSIRQPIPDLGGLPPDVASAIDQVEKLGIMTRESDGNFLPDGSVNRGELAVIVSRMLNLGK